MSGLSEVLKQLGDKMVLKNREGQRPIRAFIQPVPTREEVIPGEKTAIGWVDHCLWSYTGMEEVQPGDILVWLKTPYRVRTSRAYYVAVSCTIGGPLWRKRGRRRNERAGSDSHGSADSAEGRGH